MKRILRNKEIEDIVESRLIKYENKNGKIYNPPIPIDRIIESCNLSVLYDRIDEKPGEKIFGGLKIDKRQIVINESYMQLFRDKPGLERYTKAHELGHWDIFVDKSEERGSLYFSFYTDSAGVSYRNSVVGGVTILLNAWIDEDVYQVYKEHAKRKDRPNIASAVDRYASSLLMPKHFIMDYTLNMDLTNWGNLYKIAEKFMVTISALCVRLQRLGLVYIKDNKIYRNKEEVIGQQTFRL